MSGGKRLRAIVSVIFYYLSTLIVLMLTSRLMKSLPAETGDLLSVCLASLLTLGLVYVFTRRAKLRLSDVGLKPGNVSLPRFAIGYATGLLMAAIQAITALAFGHLTLTLTPDLTVQVVLPLLLYLFVAVREELVFRSYALRSLEYALSPAIALTLITMIFTLEHVLAGVSWKMSVIGSGFGGILFGVAALKTRGLALPLGLHAAWNTGQWITGFKNKPGVWTAVVEKGYENQTENVSLVAFVIVMLLAIAGVMVVYRSKDGSNKPFQRSPSLK